METVKFQCGKCQKVMAVGADLLGKQVRCPHCQQVIMAPASAPAPVLAPAGAAAPAPGGAPEVVFRMPAPRTEEEGSIFGETEEEGDDLFNSPRVPTVELPPAPPSPPSAPVHAPACVATIPMPALGQSNGAATAEAHGEAAIGESPADRARQLARLQSQKENKMTFMLLIVIVPYALIMTIAVIFLVLTRPSPNPRGPSKLLPDTGGRNLRFRNARRRRGPLSDEVKVALERPSNQPDRGYAHRSPGTGFPTPRRTALAAGPSEHNAWLSP